MGKRGVHPIALPPQQEHTTGVISAAGQNPIPNTLATSLGGMRRNIEQASNSAQKIAEGDLSPDNFVALMQAEVEFKANRVVATTADSMIGTLLDQRA